MPAKIASGSDILYYGDNLTILRNRNYIKDESVDLVYIDPPFNSNVSYNVLFKGQHGSRAAAQIKAFSDTWRWDDGVSESFDEITAGGGKVSQALRAFRQLMDTSDMLAYLTMMAPRLVELHRVLKPTGNLYLHCDPGASHYLKILLDAIFGPENFRNEIVWMRTGSKGLTTRRLPRNHDLLLSYQCSEASTWNGEAIYTPYNVTALDTKTATKYRHRDPDGRLYRLDNLINPNPNRPNLTYEFLGVTRTWRWTRDRMQTAYEAGIVVQTRPGAVPSLKRFIDEQRGRPFSDVWTDIDPLNSQARERQGYPTQKPVALLKRIIECASNPGDVVLDAFCGCGTAISAAQQVDRRWIGIDVTFAAITVIRNRLRDEFPDMPPPRVIGEPETLEDAEVLATTDRYQFQWWVLGRVGGRPAQEKKGADGGIDGRLYFDDEDNGYAKEVIISVKSGPIPSTHIRELRGTVEGAGAAIGVLLTYHPPTLKMRQEAARAGTYESLRWGKRYPRLQILTVADLLAGKEIKCPPLSQTNRTFAKSPRHKAPDDSFQPPLHNMNLLDVSAQEETAVPPLRAVGGKRERGIGD